jgi:membrane-associated phospholipid phosphatase
VLKAASSRSSGRQPGSLAASAGRAVGTLAAGGAVTVATCWATGKLMQSEAVIRPSRQVYDYVWAHRSKAVARRLEQVVTTIGDYAVIGPFSTLVGGIVAYERRDWAPLPLLVGGMVSEVYLQKALKRLVKGTKPPQEFSIGPPGDFPSGGAARAVITFGLLAHLLAQRWSSPAERRVIWLIALSLMTAQGTSRLYLGRHWPEDVLGGWLLGGLILGTLRATLRSVTAAGGR